MHGSVGTRANAQQARNGITLNPRFLQTETNVPRHLNQTRHPHAERRREVRLERGRGDPRVVPMQNVRHSQSGNGRQNERRVPSQLNQTRDPDVESGREVPQCCCCSMLGDNIAQDQSTYGKCCKTFLYGTLVAFAYLLSVIFLLAICPIVVVFTIIIYSAVLAATYLIALKHCQYTSITFYWSKIQKYFKKCSDLLCVWFNYFDKQWNCHGCRTCHNILYYVIFYFVITIGIVCSMPLFLVSFLLGVIFSLAYLFFFLILWIFLPVDCEIVQYFAMCRYCHS